MLVTASTSPGGPAGVGPAAPAGRGLPLGAQRTTTRYIDRRGRYRTARMPVPVDQYGHLAGVWWWCRRCRDGQWFPDTPGNPAGRPVCEIHDVRMRRRSVRRAALLPWRDMWEAAEPQLRPLWPFAAAIPAAAMCRADQLPAWVLSAAGLAAAAAARRVALRWLVRRRPNVTDSTRRLRTRTVGYATLAGWQWIAVADAAGFDPHTAGGLAVCGLWAAAATGSSVPWWRWLAQQRNRPAPPHEPAPAGPVVDPDEAAVRRVWDTIVAAEKDRTVIGYRPDGTPILAGRSGKLADTALEGWHRVEGGWAAAAVGPPGLYTSEAFYAARGQIASAFRMKAHMVTILPDPEDENRALISTQRVSPINGVQRWAGPDSIDTFNPRSWTAPFIVYKDKTVGRYEIYRPGWGPTHDLFIGTTGSGKSDAMCQALTIDRWTYHQDPDTGGRRGLVADLLIDPQQGQSFGPFLDDLAAPVACTLDEAVMLVGAVQREMYRRNRYLASFPWVDDKNRPRRGKPCWDPVRDGPIIVVTIDEAHQFLANKVFTTLVVAGARMYRKTGIRLRLATHTPLLADLGGSTALRDMLTGGFVWVGRTANSLSGPVAFNGRLPVDPRTIPEVPGMAYVLSGTANKAMLGRTTWEPDWYDWIRDDDDAPVGYPADLPPETLAAFGADFAGWVAHLAGPAAGLWTPGAAGSTTGGVVDSTPSGGGRRGVRCADAVLTVLSEANGPLDMDALDAGIRSRFPEVSPPFSTRTIREVLAQLRGPGMGLVFSSGGRHELTPQARADIEATRAEQQTIDAADGHVRPVG